MEPPDQPQGEGIARPRAWWTSVLLSLFLAAVGWVALQYRELLWPRQGDEVIDYQEKGMSWSQGFSYDVPFLVRQSLPSWFGPLGNPPRQVLDEVVVIYMDDESNRRLEQIQSCIWSRKLHARLLDRLTLDGPRAVMFDAFFDSETPEDAAFAEAMRKNGRVFLGVAIEMNSDAPLTLLEQARFNAVGLTSERLTKRNQTLYSAALGWGVLTFRPMESDYGVRRLFVGKPREGNDPWPAVTWVMAQHFNAGMPLDEGSRFARRWVNYYGPSGVIQGISYYRLLTENAGVPAGYFRDKIVIIGSRSGFASQANRRLDEFSTPWSRFRGRVTTPGAEVHATMLLNLLHHDWLERVSPATERWFVVLLGLALGALWWLRPGPAALVLALVALVVFAVSCWMQWQDRRWWNWTVPVVVQIPVAFVVTVASRYYVEASHRRKLRQAAEIYLSPDLVKQISDDTFSLKPGGKKVVATLVFTDIEAFSKLSEKLDDPDRLSRVLIDYFTATTEMILAEKGTVIKFAGDGIFAAWGAPLPQSDHAERAVRAMWRLAQLKPTVVPIKRRADGTMEEFTLRTRIGIHTGEALAGNLGSARRLDYTLIGDNTNFASRLEGANKYTGTTILVSDSTAQLLAGKFLLRRVGSIKVVNKDNSVLIYEVLGENPAARPRWLDAFEAALDEWTRGNFAAAQAGFEVVMKDRQALEGKIDGPAEFYLKRLARPEVLAQSAAATPWTGEVELEGK